MHWPVPRYLLGLVPFKFATYNRLGDLLLLPPYMKSSVSWLMTTVLSAYWRIVEAMFSWQFGINFASKTNVPVQVKCTYNADALVAPY